MGLRLEEQKGPRHARPLFSDGMAPHLGAQQASWAQVDGANALLSPSAPLIWEGPSRLPLLISPASLYAPRDPHGLEGALEGRVLAWELSRLPVPKWPGWLPSAPLLPRKSLLPASPALPTESLPPASPDLPSLRGANIAWPPLLLPPQSPCVLLVHFGVPPVSLGIRSPHQRPAGALVAGRC